MPLARLENLLKNLNGNILYVDPAQLDATDSVDNRGNSALRPFKTIQRALLEAVRFSYVQGPNNDLFDQTTILISPGTHYIDNRPGYYVDGTTFKNYSGSTVTLPELTLQSIMDLTDPSNELYKYNSADGGVIIPRGVSIVSNDLRKTKIRPKYVPSPTDNLVSRSAIFRLTGSCYIYGFSIFDGDPNGNVYSYPASTVQTPPSYSHHKLTAFEYADGKNQYVKNGVSLNKTDLEMYYYKVAKGFGQNSGIPVIIDWGVNTPPDLYPNIEENRIVGDLGFGSNTISTIYAGNGDLLDPQITNTITVTTTSEHNLSPNTSIVISNIGGNAQERAEYNGSFTVAQVVDSTTFTYRLASNPISSIVPTVNSDSTVTTVSDTVSSSSPYVFNCSLKSVYGLNGLHADGSKSTGFKSIVTAQFTGISLQKDDNAFVVYNEQSGTYNDQTSFPDEFLHQNSRARYKPDWETFHIKASNDAFIQCVSIFAIGYANHFLADEGGDQSITNSNSNFGSIALSSKGFKDYNLEKDNFGFITHIIPPKDVPNTETDIRFLKLDSLKTSSVNDSTKVFLKDYNNILNVPPIKSKQFTVGGKYQDKIYFKTGSTEYEATISPNYKLDIEISSIDDSTNTITLSENLTVGSITGINTSQKVRVVSNNGVYPDGIEPNKVYYVNQSVTTNTLQLSENESSSLSADPEDIININTIGATSGNLRLISKVSDRNSGDVASPIQFDSVNSGWYINIESNQTFVDDVSNANDPSSSLKRIVENRNLDDKLYRARIVIPKESVAASEPSIGFILQKSSTAISENYTKQGASALTSLNDSRNTNQIVDAWIVSGSPNIAHIVTKNPHNLKEGNSISIYNLKSSNEPSPVGLGTGTGYNGRFTVDSVIDDLHFTYEIGVDPGTITTTTLTSTTNWMSTRNCGSTTYRIPPYTIESSDDTRNNLPYFTCEKINNEYQLYKINPIQKFIPGVSDGVYYATLNAYKNVPDVSPFNINDLRFSQSVENLYPNSDPDNLVTDPEATKTVASRKIIGKVDVNDTERSVTKETLVEFFKDFDTGFDVVSISQSGTTSTITTSQNHGLSGISALSIPGGSVGSGYVNGTWYDIPLCGGSGQNATANVTVSGGAIVSAVISNLGSGYIAGDVVTLKGVPHSSINGQTVNITVISVFTANDRAIKVLGCKKSDNNGIFPIISLTANTISYTNSNGITESYSGIEQSSVAILSNQRLNVQSLAYDSLSNSTTITIATSSSPHSVLVGNKIYFSSIPSSEFDVISVQSNSIFVVDGDASAGTSAFAYVVPLAPSLRDSNSSNENLSARHYPLIGEISTRTSSQLSSTSTNISVSSSRGFAKSNFIQIDDEIMMITNVNGSILSVLRGIFNTKQASHISSSLVRKIKSIPVELRRNSILRASGHTFEYTGFGPGNYSTGMPTNQDRILSSDEVLISQSLATRGGSVLYTGMNSDGEFYIGKKKFNALTGEEQLLGIPDAEGESGYADDLVVNNLTVINTIDAESAVSQFGRTTISNLTVTNDVQVNGDLNVDGIISGELNHSISDGDGLTGGTFNNSSDVTISLGTPSGITSTSINSTTASSHTHQLDDNAVTTSKINDGAVITSKINDGAVTASKLNGGQTGNPPIFGVRAWVIFNGTTNPPTILASGNVQSVAISGGYVITFETPMPDINYAVVATSGSLNGAANDDTFDVRLITDTMTVNQFTLKFNRNTSNDDSGYLPPKASVMVIR